MIELQKYWWPLATLGELDSGKLLARTLLGIPLVLFRDASGQIAALLDRCPHRHAPLSCGRVVQGEVECPYHGWHFAANGRCTGVPGLEPEPGGPQLIRAFSCRQAHGLIWACSAPDMTTPQPVSPAEAGCRLDTFFMVTSMHCTIAEAAENFLDGFHTHFVHAGWLRRDKKRQSVRVNVRRLTDGVEAHYSGEGLQSGLISSLLEGDRTYSVGRFRLPGIAEIEYRGSKGINLLVTAWLTPESSDCIRIHARVATSCGMLPGWLKKALLQHLFGVIMRQDKAILEQTHANMMRFEYYEQTGPNSTFLDSPLDLLGPFIRRLMNGEILEDVEKNVTVKL